MITLYQRQACPDSMKVKAWLGRNNIDFKVINVPKLTSQRKELIELTGTGIVPVIKDGDKIIKEVNSILNYLEENYGHSNFGDPGYGLTINLGEREFSVVREQIVEKFKEQGFGLQTEMNLTETFKKKINKDFRPYSILGFCHPHVAFQALQTEPGIGLLLPCNVTLTQDGNGDIVVSAVDPLKIFSVVDREDIKPIAKKIKEQLINALNSLNN